MTQKNVRKMTQCTILSSLAVVLAIWSANLKAQAVGPNDAGAAASPGAIALEKAAKDNKYLFILLYTASDAQANAMNGALQNAMTKLADRANSIAINAADPAEKAIIDRFGVRGAPLPMILAIAPTGAPTRAFPKKVTEAQLEQAFVTPCTAKCMRAIFDRRSVLLCVQGDKTQYNQEAMEGVNAFAADPQYTKGTAIVTLNPADQAEQSFLKAVQVDPNTAVAVTVLVTPPGAPVARLAGAVTKEQIETAVKAAQSSCGPGCSCHK
jgi:hypothetical protein